MSEPSELGVLRQLQLDACNLLELEDSTKQSEKNAISRSQIPTTCVGRTCARRNGSQSPNAKK